MAEEQGVPVELYIYDLSRGLASLLSPSILGRQIEGVWHTSVVVFGREYFFGGGGITYCDPGSTSLGAPLQTQALGETFVPPVLFTDYVHGLATTSYTPSSYNMLEHNCNTFSDEVAQFLCGARVPKHILALPEEALAAPARAALASLLGGLLPQGAAGAGAAMGARRARGDSPDYTTLNDQIELARQESAALAARRSSLADKLARKQRRSDKKRRKEALRSGCEDMAEALSVSEAEAAAPGPARPAAGPRAAGDDERPGRPRAADDDERPARPREPPIVFNDLDGEAEFAALSAALGDAALSEAERQSLDELRQYLQGEGSWVLGDAFLDFIGRLLQDAALPSAARVAALRCLAACGRRDDVSLLLHGDRRTHALLNYAAALDTLPLPEQRALALFICNLFEQVAPSEWLMYISEWEVAGRPLSNIRATTKVCVAALLSEDEPLRELGAAILYNVASKEVKTVVFDDVSVELCMAALAALGTAPPEPRLWRVLAALAALVRHGGDLPQLVLLVGPSPDTYRGTSPRVDEQIDRIMQLLHK